MKDLLPYFERELAFLRNHGRTFAERYPKVAAQLSLSGDGCEDPHVERMIESFALLTARVSKKIEDGYPQFTEALLSVLYPHYLRAFPSCSIASFSPPDKGVSPELLLVPRGTELQSRPIKGTVCRFRTVWDLAVSPVSVSDLKFDPAAGTPSGVQLPAGCDAILSFSLLRGGDTASAAIVAPGKLRIYIDAEPSVASALRDALFLNRLRIYVEATDRIWDTVPEDVLSEVGFATDEALIDMPQSAHDAYRYLTEYFCFPEKFNFFDLDLRGLPAASYSKGRVRLHVALGGLRSDSDASRLLKAVTAQNLRLGCVPVVNLFKQCGDPIRVSGQASSYPVIPDGRRPSAYEVYSIDSVHRVRQTLQGESIVEFRPFFSLRHGETPDLHGHYWFAQRDSMIAESSPGFETLLSVIDTDCDPFQPKNDVLSLRLTCSNRDLPTLMSWGGLDGDLLLEGGSQAALVRLLKRPSQPWRFDHRGDAQWRLISHLSLNHLSLTGSGLAAFKEMLALYDLPQTATSRRRLEGLLSIERVDKTVWMKGKPFACFVRGFEVRLTIDESSFVGSGLHAFARCIDRFLGLYVGLNSFIQLVILSGRTGEELIRCAPRSGDSALA
ncbi:type VI secretion system baseplate subunit TssF [Zoogloea sp. LCSB751]|uniref:type VI secretion system baseplate subunit TssF n=1 Tax=Zoogloea sp. LCSB751 TaxID=1965277 RepID=UPI0009A4E46D|nr:type VI secretion system baseplate subunit TssF [Zoogloea sp. LCSB751]